MKEQRKERSKGEEKNEEKNKEKKQGKNNLTCTVTNTYVTMMFQENVGIHSMKLLGYKQ